MKTLNFPIVSEDIVYPFGLVVTAGESGTPLTSLPVEQIQTWVRQHRVLVLRGFAPPIGDDLTAFGASLGEVLEWSFGSVNELKVKSDAKNYLYTPSEVPFHWDGAFVGRIPHYIVFHCEEAPDPASGGETLFTDAISLLEQAPEERRQLWAGTSITYSTEKIAHYGGSFTSPMIGTHPVTGETVLRYAEPVEDLNPVFLEIPGLNAAEAAELIADLRQRLRRPELCYAHIWQDDDIVIADNHALLHGRNAFKAASPRHIRRVNVL
jgi:alpha-ketoglutarate-dependent taurine dioxygenase